MAKNYDPSADPDMKRVRLNSDDSVDSKDNDIRERLSATDGATGKWTQQIAEEKEKKKNSCCIVM